MKTQHEKQTAKETTIILLCNLMLRFIIPVIVVVMLFIFTSCSQKTCPTYAGTKYHKAAKF